LTLLVVLALLCTVVVLVLFSTTLFSSQGRR